MNIKLFNRKIRLLTHNEIINKRLAFLFSFDDLFAYQVFYNFDFTATTVEEFLILLEDENKENDVDPTFKEKTC